MVPAVESEQMVVEYFGRGTRLQILPDLGERRKWVWLDNEVGVVYFVSILKLF